ncbi:hypothetical protein CROQUDRAFT_87652 [Cronartium quercuum f. sp. fusiforme G11]|uniref:Uncharacterized protein n=1 Tax=Cronartium quercuum f. sp. fusiforme G11 TaxID=708437 RepID=A0A9P6NV17_9BASI|nr:hypothetical protein CROQUDRAFT_87652 [Cronartium quercuum f. sp. fusiforme G11]
MKEHPKKVPRCQLGPLLHASRQEGGKAKKAKEEKISASQVISPELTKRDAMNAPAGVPYDAFGSIESIGYHVLAGRARTISEEPVTRFIESTVHTYFSTNRDLLGPPTFLNEPTPQGPPQGFCRYDRACYEKATRRVLKSLLTAPRLSNKTICSSNPQNMSVGFEGPTNLGSVSSTIHAWLSSSREICWIREAE